MKVKMKKTLYNKFSCELPQPDRLPSLSDCLPNVYHVSNFRVAETKISEHSRGGGMPKKIR